jgi:hypothetical protein
MWQALHQGLIRSRIGALLLAFTIGKAAAVDYPPDFPKPSVLPPPTEKVVFRKELLGKHPRIFVDAAAVEAFREKIKNPIVAPLWADYLGAVDAMAADNPPAEPGNDNQMNKTGGPLPRFAFAYLITHDPRYLADALKWIHAILQYPNWADQNQMTFDMAVSYDWLYNDLSPDNRQQIETALLKYARLLLNESARAPNNYWGGAYFMSYSWMPHTGISTAAMALYDKFPDEMQGWLDYTRSRFQPTYLHLAADDGYHENIPYFAFGAVWCMRYIESLREISGEDLGDMSYVHNLTRELLDFTMPDGRSVANFGDTDAFNGPPDDEIYTWATLRKDGYAEWLRQKIAGKFTQKHVINSPFALLWLDPSVTPQAPDALPTTGLYADMGEVVFRSSWQDDAAVVVFKCGPPGGHYMVENKAAFPACAFRAIHYHPDANSFYFWSDRQWRIASPAGYTVDKKTQSENVWLVGGKGQKGGDHGWFDPTGYFAPGLAQPHLVRVATSPAADYVIGEAAPAYVPDCKLTEFTRHLLFVKGVKPYIVVYDRLKSDEAQSWVSSLHTFGQIDVADNQSFSSVGALHPNLMKESFLKLSSFPVFTPAYGVVLGPAGTTLDAHPLNVLGFPGGKPENRGFELLAQPPGTSQSTWLITVVGVEKSAVTLVGSDPTPSIQVGQDHIAWDQDDNVSLNDRRIEGNLLPK